MSAVAPKPTSVATVAMPSSASPRPAASSGSRSGTTSALGSTCPALRRFLASPKSFAAVASRPDRHQFPGFAPVTRSTLKRLVAFVRERFGRRYCRETIRSALRRLDLSWKKAKKLLGRADPERRESFIGQIGALLDGARDERHTLVYLDEAHIHQDVDLGYGWCERGHRFYIASSSPGLAAKVSFYGLSVYNEGQVRIWSYPRANGEHPSTYCAAGAPRSPRAS